MAIEDHPARANHEHAVAIERQLETATKRYDDAVKLAKEVSDRKDELLDEIVRSNDDNLIKAHSESDAAFVKGCWLEEHLVEMYFPSLNLMDFDDVPDTEAATQYLKDLGPALVDQLYEWSREQRKHERLSLKFRGQLDRHGRRIIEEFEGLRAREEPLGWDVENRRMEVARARIARNPDFHVEYDDLSPEQQQKLQDELDSYPEDVQHLLAMDEHPGSKGFMPAPHPNEIEPPSQEYWDQFNAWASGESEVPPPELAGLDESGVPINISFDDVTGEPVFRESSIIAPKEIAKLVEANDRELARVEAANEEHKAQRDYQTIQMQERIAYLEAQLVDDDTRPKTKYIKSPFTVTKHKSENMNRGCNTLNKMNEQGRLIQTDATKDPIRIYLMMPNGQKGQHTREMLALRQGVVVDKDRVWVEVKSRMNEDQNQLHVWFPDFQKYGYVCVMVPANGTLQCWTALHEDANWVQAENELYPGIKQTMGEYALEQLKVIHEEIKAHLEANTVASA